LKYYIIEDNSTIAEHKGENPIVKIFPNPTGTKVICMDNTGNGYLYNPIDDSQVFVPNFSAETNKILWDVDDPNLFVTVDSEKM
jgi:WD repeat-containing protein 19